MNNRNILIVQCAWGPTYRKRLLKNLRECDGYDLYDVFIMTDQVEDFKEVMNKENIYIRDINEMRKDYPWSIEYEQIPEEKIDDKKYTEEISKLKIPTLLRRFVFLWEKVENYDGFIFMDCDVIPIKNLDTYEITRNYFTNKITKHPFFNDGEDLTGKMIVIPGGQSYEEPYHPFLLEYAKKINEKYKITDRELVWDFRMTDGNFRTVNFPDKSYCKKFFELINNIVYDTLVEKEYFFLATHSIWNAHSEYIISIALNLFGGAAYPKNTEGIGLGPDLFRVDCYPEDRYWCWNLLENAETKEEFIKINYDKLKTFYENRGQVFPY